MKNKNTLKTIIIVVAILIISVVLSVLTLDVWCINNMIGEFSFFAVCRANGWLVQYFMFLSLITAAYFLIIDIIVAVILNYKKKK